MKILERPSVRLALLCVVAFVVRIAWQLHVDMYGHPDVWESDAVARNLVEGRGFVFHYFGFDWLTFGTPAYPALLAALHILSGGARSYWLIGLVEAATSVGLVLVAYSIASELAGRRAGAIAAVVVAFHPALVVYAGKVHEMTFEALCAGSVVALALRARAPQRRGRGVLLGVAGGLAALTRPTLAALDAVVFAFLGLVGVRRQLIRAIAIALIIAAPWTIRNAIVLGPGAGAAPFTCVTLWIGNNPESGGGTLSRDGRDVLTTMPPEMLARIEGQPEQVQGRVFCEEAIHFLAADPLASLGWWLQKIEYFWWTNPHEGAWYPAGWIELYLAGYIPEVALAAFGLVHLWLRRDRSDAALLTAELAVISIAQSFFYVDGRHRLLLEPTVAALAAIGLVTAVDRARHAVSSRRPVARAERRGAT